jgi:hypothetical protein
VEETVQEVGEERPDLQLGIRTSATIRKLSSRFGRRNSTKRISKLIGAK